MLGVAAVSDVTSTLVVVNRQATKARRNLRPFMTGCTVTKGLAGDSGKRREEGG